MSADTMREALQHIAAGHDSVCTHCDWIGPKDSRVLDESLYPELVCPKCYHTVAIGADEIAAYALRQVGGGE